MIYILNFKHNYLYMNINLMFKWGLGIDPNHQSLFPIKYILINTLSFSKFIIFLLIY